MNIYFKNIRAIDPQRKLDEKINLWIKNGNIEHCSSDEAKIDNTVKVVNGERLIAAPGFFDMHVHLREPGEESKETIESGTQAAMNGGFTGILCMPNTTPAIDDITVAEYIKHKAQGRLVDVEIAGCISQKREGELLAPMLELNDAGVRMFTDIPRAVPTAESMRRAFEYASTKDLLIAQHCEDVSLSGNSSMNESKLSFQLGLKGNPTVSEQIILQRDIILSEYTGNRRYHAHHISTKGSVEIIRKAKSNNLRVTCAVTPHHLLLTEDKVKNYDTNFKMDPPLRSEIDRQALIEGLQDGTIDCIVSEHAPHILQDKDVPFEIAPNGIIGLETTIGLVLTHLVNTKIIDYAQMIEKISINPRKILGIEPPQIKTGDKANISLFDPEEEWIVNQNHFKSKSANTPFEGNRLKGKPKYTVNNGQIYESEL